MDVITFVNYSAVMTNEHVAAVMPAMQSYADIVASAWRVPKVQIAFSTTPPTAGRLMELFDHTDTPGAGGYHTDENGHISGKAFVGDALDGGESPWVDVSHELAEMMVDPTAGTDPSQYVNLQGQDAGKQCLKEVCDAVEADNCAFQITIPGVSITVPGTTSEEGGNLIVPMSDFVLPPYFFEESDYVSPAWPQGAPRAYDYMGHLTSGPAPMMLYGGYLGIRLAGGSWSQVSDFSLGVKSRRSQRHGRTAWAIQMMRNPHAAAAYGRHR